MRASRKNGADLQRVMLIYAFVAVSFWTLVVLQWYFTAEIAPALLIIYALASIGGSVAFFASFTVGVAQTAVFNSVFFENRFDSAFVSGVL